MPRVQEPETDKHHKLKQLAFQVLATSSEPNWDGSEEWENLINELEQTWGVLLGSWA